MRVLLIEDHPLMRAGLAQLLVRTFAGSRVEEADCAASALGKLPSGPWNLIILDIDLPDRSGIDLLADIQRIAPKAGVLVLSGHSEKEFGQRVLQSGADGYIEKGSPSSEVIEAVRRVNSGKRYISQELASVLAESMIEGNQKFPHERLSAREFEVLRAFGQGCTLTEIARKLAISVKTASTYGARIRQKLGLRTSGEVVRYAVENKVF